MYLQELKRGIREELNFYGDAALWLFVILDAYETMLNHSHNVVAHEFEQAKSFLFEPNEIFDNAAAIINQDPEDLRKRIRLALLKEGICSGL